jgi:electron transport complex protein RnfG
MTAPETVAPARSASIAEMYRALVGVGLLCALIIVTVYEVTKPIIADNRAEALKDAVFTVIPGADASETFRPDDGDGFVPVRGESSSSDLIYAGYDEDGELAGVALTARGMGYADVITILYGYSFEEEAIVGMQVLESKETPGLGDKIEKDEAFKANFESLDVQLGPDGETVAHPIETVKQGEKTEPWQIDGITGATISSVAIGDMLRASTKKWIPELEAHRASFEQEASDHE